MFIIRPAQKEDMQALLEIYNEAIEKSFAVYVEEKTTLSEREIWFEKRQEAGYPVLVAQSLETQEIMGYASFGNFRIFPGFAQTIEHSIYVSTSHQRKGVASSLLQALLGEAKKSKKKIMIGAIDSENISSIALHKKFDFKETGHLEKVAYKFHTWRDLIFMQKEIF